MKAVILKETRRIVVGEVPDAETRETTDVLLRLTSTAICGIDLNFYEGRMRGLEGNGIGHEPLGVVQEVGSAVKNVKKGDRVTVPTHSCCGFCAMCAKGHTSACLTTNPGQAGARMATQTRAAIRESSRSGTGILGRRYPGTTG